MRLESLLLTRHGESLANAVRLADLPPDAEVLPIPARDADTPLSELGRRQAAAFGGWLAALPPDQRPTAVVASPYVRTRQTAEIALRAIGSPPVRLDERLRDRETGVLHGLTPHGMLMRYPAEVHRKEALGKFYYRPPAGESWADVALRLRSALHDVEAAHPQGRVLLVVHDAVVILARYVVEELTERRILEIERTPIANCSVTRWQFNAGVAVRTEYNETGHLAPVMVTDPGTTGR